MAKKTQRGEKTAAVSEYLDAHPGAGPKEIVEALAKQHIKITTAHVSNIKGKLNKGGKAKKAAKKPALVEAAAPAVVEKPTNGGTLTLEQVKKVAQTIKTLGGYQRVLEVLEVIKELGGVKKFRDLAEAMTVTNTDDIPF
jgi:arginine repressor